MFRIMIRLKLIFVDFKENTYSHIDEFFSVKVKLNLKEGQSDEGDYYVDNKSNSNNRELYGGIGGGIGSLIVIIIIFYYCCGRTKTYEVKEKSTCVIF